MNAPDFPAEMHTGLSVVSLASVESEQALLGGLLLDAGLWDVVGDILAVEDFFRIEHREIFSAIAQLVTACKPVDIITVFEHMRSGGFKAGVEITLPELHALAQSVPTQRAARQYAETVRQRALSRKLMGAADDIHMLARNHQLPFSDRLEQATAHLVTLMPDTASEDWLSIDDTIVKLLDSITERAEGNVDFLPTGLAGLDDLLDGGLRAGQLVIVGARPSMGKSALAVTIGQNVAKAGHPVAMFSLEMPAQELATRQLSMVSHIHLSKLRRPERLNNYDWSRMTAGVEELRRISFHVSEHSGLNINQLRTRARKQMRQHGLKLLIVDYIGLMTGLNPKESRNYQLGEASRGMKSLAKELGIPIICLAQLGREVEKRTNARPILSDLRDSGEIEQDADIVMFIDRPIHRNPALGPEWANYAEAILAKQRNGSTGSVDMRYIGENVQFLDWEGDKPTRSSGGRGGDL